MATVLATRLEAVLLISQEQNGSIRGRQLFFNTRTLLNTLICPTSPEVIVSLDAEKALNGLNRITSLLS